MPRLLRWSKSAETSSLFIVRRFITYYTIEEKTTCSLLHAEHMTHPDWRAFVRTDYANLLVYIEQDFLANGRPLSNLRLEVSKSIPRFDRGEKKRH